MKKKTETEFTYKFGRMIKGQSSLMLSEDQLSDTLNLTPGYGWKQRKGMTALTASAVATGLRFKSAIQFRTLDGTTDVLLAHTYDSTNGERIMKGSALPPSSITWSEMYDLTSGCETAQWAVVSNAVVIATGDDFLIWLGEDAKPTGVFFYDDTSGKYVSFYDEMTDGDTATSMDLSSMTADDEVILLSEMPIDTWSLDVGNANSNSAGLLFSFFTGVWTNITCEASNESYDSDEFDDLNDWTDLDNGTGVSVATTFGGKTVLSQFSGSTAGHYALLRQDLGAINHTPVIAFRTYFTNLGTHAQGDSQRVYIYHHDVGLMLSFASNNLYMHTGAWADTGVSVPEDEWATWVFYPNFTTAATAKCDVWLNGTKVLNQHDCSFTGSYTDGRIELRLIGDTAANVQSYWQWFNIGNGSGSVVEDPDVYTFTDGTKTGTATLAKDGDLTWSGHSGEEPTTIEGIPGYAYRLKVSAALDSSTSVLGMTVHAPMGNTTNLWDGTKTFVTGCYVYNGTKYADYTAYVNNDVEAQAADLSGATTSYRLFVGSPYRLSGIEFSPASGEPNTANSQIDKVYYHNASGAEAEPASFTDNTLANTASFNQKGIVSWEYPSIENEKATTVAGDTSPMYWYIFEWDATVSDPCSIYRIEGIPIPEDVKPSLGTFGFKRRVWQVAPLGEENAVRFSAANLPNVWNGRDSGYIYFGERPLKAAVSLYNEAMVFADTEIWMIKGNSPSNFGRLRLSGTIGLSAVNSIVTVESGILVDEKIKNVVVWFFADGIWVFDNSRIWKVSAPDIDSFFDPLHEDYINPAYLDQTYGTYDHETQTAQWIVYSGASATTPTKVIVMHFPSMWYGIYEYGTEISCILPVINDRYYTVGGAYDTGKFFRLYDGVTDLDDSGNTVEVDAYAVTRDMFMSVSDGIRQRLLSVWAESAEAGGMIELDEYPDGSLTPQNIGKRSMTWLGKLFGAFQRNLRVFSGQKTTKFRVRNRSKNARMVLIGHSTTADRGRAEE